MARKRNRETWKLELALALGEVRKASKKSKIVPEGYANSDYGIVRNIGKLMKGIDVNFVKAAAEFGWLKRARPFEGGREGYFWAGPPKVLYGKQLQKIVEIRDRMADEYERQAKEKKAAAAAAEAKSDNETLIDILKEAAPKKPTNLPPLPVEMPVEVVAVWSMPQEHINILEAYHACAKAGVIIPPEVEEYMEEHNLTETDKTSTTVDILYGEESYAKSMDAYGNVVSVDLKRLAAEHPDYVQLLIRVGPGRLHTD
jgi:hypothetical protein